MAKDIGMQERIRHLKSRLQKLDAELETLNEEQKEAQRNFFKKRQQRDSLKADLDALQIEDGLRREK